MSTRVHRIAASLLALAAVVASSVAILVSEDVEPIRAEYAVLGEALGRIAQSVELRTDLVSRATFGREFASAHGRIAGSATDSLDVGVERITARGGRPKTIVHIGVSRHTGGDVIRSPWSVSRVVPNEDFVLSSDFRRITLDTSICDERDGETKQVVVTWTMKGPFLTRPPYGMLASYGGDGDFTARYGDVELTGEDLGTVNVQIWSRPVDRGRNPRGVNIDGRHRKPVRCPS